MKAQSQVTDALPSNSSLNAVYRQCWPHPSSFQRQSGLKRFVLNLMFMNNVALQLIGPPTGRSVTVVSLKLVLWMQIC